jgi:6-phosphogluconolactonase
MNIDILPDDDAVARQGAAIIAAEARAAVASRGRFLVALSGGQTPWQMLGHLAGMDVPWSHIHVFQVDERIAPSGDPDRNLTHLEQSLLAKVAMARENLHAMPVDDANLEAAARRYASLLEELAGAPPVLDLVHLGLGPDGHTASLVPGDPALEVADRDVALTGVYKGRRRMTLTFPVLNRARKIMWLVTGREKAAMLDRLRAGDRTIPAGRVRSQDAVILADRAAATVA